MKTSVFFHDTASGLLCAPGQDQKSPAPSPKAAPSLSREKIRPFANEAIWQVVSAEKSHIPAIAADMRQEDAREVWASHRHSPEEALEYSLARSELAWTCTVLSLGTAAAERAHFVRSRNSLPASERPARASVAQEARPSVMEWRPAFMWGVARQGSLLSEKGSPWLLGTNLFFRAHKTLHREFLRRCRGYVDLMLERFPRLENFVHAENRLSIRWLTWCGFTVDDMPELINNEDFFLFWRDAHV